LPLLRVLHYAWGTTITASASQWNRTAMQLGAAGLNQVLNFLLIPRWSWQGAAVASLLIDGSLALSSRLVLWRIQCREELTR
jgi:O-antigen/teichoic acid export membrane protein